jgi:ubiquinone/menaquinone biosynthesis C-methylase UbiE
MVDSIKHQIKKHWAQSNYYNIAESEGALSLFWKNQTFVDLFARLDLSRVAELACGHGRHTAWIIRNYNFGEIVLIDINETNIDFCKSRFKENNNISYIVNSGADLSGIEDESLSSIFCYDAMVHFEFDDVFAYFHEFNRSLKQGGFALLHHSNNDKFPGNLYSQNEHWRNYMSAGLLKHMASRAGLQVKVQRIIDWGESKELDCVTLLEKI